MATFTDEEKDFLLKQARAVIESEILKGPPFERPKDISPKLKEKRGCFVTLHKNGRLRGCIGTIEPIRPLNSCIEENALNAAFRDPRFSPLEKEELPDIDIEISVLTPPLTLDFDDADDLKQKLQPGVHGVILSKGYHRATFLPQVWEQLPDKDTFLAHLCQKAGMAKTCWKDKGVSVMIYEVEYFSEAR